jgi:hypothetical protein
MKPNRKSVYSYNIKNIDDLLKNSEITKNAYPYLIIFVMTYGEEKPTYMKSMKKMMILFCYWKILDY